MLFDTSLFNTQHYNVRIKGKLEQSKEMSSTLPYTSVLQLLKREPWICPRLLSPALLYIYIYICVYPVDCGCRIHRLYFCRGVRPPSNECPGYGPKQSDGEVPVLLELFWMRSNPLLPSLSGPLWPGVVAPDRVLSMGQIELTSVLMLN